MVLPSPMSSARQEPKPKLGEHIKPLHTRLLIGPQLTLK